MKNKARKKDKKRAKTDGFENPIHQNTDEPDAESFFTRRKNVRELVSPNGVNPNPLDYMVIEDNGASLYTMCFYIHKLPSRAVFASTFAPIFNFPGVTSNVFINPLTAGRSTKLLDKRVLVLGSELAAAEKSGDRNKYRKISEKLADAETWASDIETGNNILFEVAFLFSIQATSLDSLRLTCSDFHMRAREKGIEMMSCYGVHPEAFVSGYPTNRIFHPRLGPIKSSCIKNHIMDKGALCTIFNHTRSSFSHRNGIIAGRNLHTGQPVTFDIFDPSHDGYGLICAGKTGTGKSATIKMYLSRYADFGIKIRSIDFDARGNRGEYSMMAESLGGINFQIKNDSSNVLNIFELDEEMEYDETTNEEFPTLRLADKVTDVSNLLMIMIREGKEMTDFTESKFIYEIVSDSVSQLYAMRGITDGKVESLYDYGHSIIQGRVQSGKVIKELPTISDFYRLVLHRSKENETSLYEKAFLTILGSIKNYVRELYYCPKCMRFYTAEEYDSLKRTKGYRHCSCGACIAEVHGTKAYFDGQTTVHADADTPHVNIDISQLPGSERIVGMLVAMNYMQETFIKKNSVNPRKAKKVILLVDELHRTFPFAEARRLISDEYRTARKRHVSVWTATQALADYQGYEETEGIVKNATAILLLKQSYQDRAYLKATTPLTESQLDEVFGLGGDTSDTEARDSRRGEICLIDNSNATFIKVDYLRDSEAIFVETDISKIQLMYQGGTA